MSANISWNSPDIVRDGLVLYLDAGTSNSYNRYSSAGIWKDMSGNGNSGSLVNGPTFDSANGGSILFDGIDDGGTTSYSNQGTNNTSQMVWIKWNGTNQTGLIIYLGNPANSGFGLIVNDGSNTGTSGNKVSVLYGGTFWNALETGTTFATLNSNEWTQLILTRDSLTTKLYQNGIFLGSTTRIPNNYLNSLNFILPINPPTVFGGNISVVAFYNRTISDTEVLQNYNSTKGRFGL